MFFVAPTIPRMGAGAKVSLPVQRLARRQAALSPIIEIATRMENQAAANSHAAPRQPLIAFTPESLTFPAARRSACCVRSASGLRA
jgi:hypothetical protein